MKYNIQGPGNYNLPCMDVSTVENIIGRSQGSLLEIFGDTLQIYNRITHYKKTALASFF